MKGLHGIIKLRNWTLDQRRRELGELLAARAKLDQDRAELLAQRDCEQADIAALEDAARMTVGAYAQVLVQKLAQNDADIADMEAAILNAQVRVSEAYQDLRKFELYEEQLRDSRSRSEARKQQEMLDEIALNLHRQNR